MRGHPRLQRARHLGTALQLQQRLRARQQFGTPRISRDLLAIRIQLTQRILGLARRHLHFRRQQLRLCKCVTTALISQGRQGADH